MFVTLKYYAYFYNKKPFIMKTSYSIILRMVIIFLGILITLPGCKKNSTDIDPIPQFSLGVILPMDQDKGLLRENALRTAIDAINEAGGVGSGARLNLVVKSSAGTSREQRCLDVGLAPGCPPDRQARPVEAGRQCR